MFFRPSTLIVSAAVVALLFSVACSPGRIVEAILPDPPDYPDFSSEEAVLAEAQRLSDGLDAHIDAWLAGSGPARIPDELLSEGMDRIDGPYELARPEDLPPEERVIVRPADYELDFARLRGLYPDPHCTYIVGSTPYAPFGHRLVVEGEFPHARFFDIQVSPPLDPEFYYYAKQFGAPEVAIVDADIDPLPGHTNPFRPGADRETTERSYRVTFELVAGNGKELEPAYREPLHRAPGNTRKASLIQYQGPLAYEKIVGGHRRGPWDDGTLWIRYYAPDRGTEPLAGVPLPRWHLETPEGEAYCIRSVNRAAEEAAINKTFAAREVAGKSPTQGLFSGPDFGWLRDLGIFHGGITGIYAGNGLTSPEQKAEARALVKGLTARGGDLEPPGSDMSSNSRVPYISYLSRAMNLADGYVAVLTGKLPTFPPTLAGATRMAGDKQLRYLSFTLYPDPNFLRTEDIGTPHASVMDEEIAVDDEGRYTIVYSRAADRPANAKAPGITWQDWGPGGMSGWTIRWLTVGPDWARRGNRTRREQRQLCGGFLAVTTVGSGSGERECQRGTARRLSPGGALHARSGVRAHRR